MNYLDKAKNKLKWTTLSAGFNYNEFINRHTKYNYYYPNVPISGFEPHENTELFNKYGEMYKVCFLSNYGYEDKSRYLYFDRYDWGLNTHIYKGTNMLRTVGKPLHKIAYTTESREIEPYEYSFFDKYPKINEDFDMIITTDDILLNKYANACFGPVSCAIFYSLNDDLAYEKKTKDISIIASKKRMTKYHDIRISIAQECRSNGLADTYGSFSGVFLENYDDAFKDYRYSIVIENHVSDYYFTEKIASCFQAHTIPIYLGARKISDFFNPDGIIEISEKDLDSLPKILKECNKEDYENRLEAVADNYKRVQEFRNGWDWIYLNVLKGRI